MSEAKSITVTSVAKHAGLSRATVDRVLNKRGKVSAETRQRVERAVEELGYASNRMASLMIPKSKRVEVILSDGRNPFFQELRSVMGAAVSTEVGGTFELHGFDPYRPESLVKQLKKVRSATDAVIMVGVDNDAVASEINRLRKNGTRVVTLVSDVSSSEGTIYVGQDNFLAGRTAGRLTSLLLGEQNGAVAILIGHLQFRHLLDRRSGFEQFMNFHCPEINILHVRPYGSDASGFCECLEQLKTNHPDLAGLYLTGSGQPEIYDAVRSFAPEMKFLAHEVTEHSRAALADGTLDAVVASNLGEVCRLAIEASLTEKTIEAGRTEICVHVAENLPTPASGPE